MCFCLLTRIICSCHSYHYPQPVIAADNQSITEKWLSANSVRTLFVENVQDSAATASYIFVLCVPFSSEYRIKGHNTLIPFITVVWFKKKYMLYYSCYLCVTITLSGQLLCSNHTLTWLTSLSVYFRFILNGIQLNGKLETNKKISNNR